MRVLYVFYEDKLVGTFSNDPDDTSVFAYAPDWMENRGFPISLSLPLREEPYVSGPAKRFFANLLPEGNLRQLVTRRLGLSEDNDFSLLSAIGGECAGALTLHTTPDPPKTDDYDYKELSKVEIEQFLRTGGALEWASGVDNLRLSLAGAQDKLPILYLNGTIYLPVGGAPSSHILKFPNANFKHLPANEALVAQIAASSGLLTSRTELLLNVVKEPLCLVERYDRYVDSEGKIKRRHQEDFCQALDVDHRRKYEAEGGPGFASCLKLLADHSEEPLPDSARLIDWLVFNAGVGNADGHGKNISLVYGEGGAARLAPFYDLVCTAAYKSLSPNLAMRIGDCTKAGNLTQKNIFQLASDLGVGKNFLVRRFKATLERVSASIDPVVKEYEARYGSLAAVQMAIPRIRKSLRKMLAALAA